MSRKPESLVSKAAKAALLIVLLPIIVPFAIFGIVFYFLNKLVVYLLVWTWWLPKGKDVLYVSSDSTIWKDYMETEILPLVAKRAITLNWSARQSWPNWSLAVRVFRTFGRGHDFNPMIVLFRPWRHAECFRFLPAFQELKHGDRSGIETLRHDIMQALD